MLMPGPEHCTQCETGFGDIGSKQSVVPELRCVSLIRLADTDCAHPPHQLLPYPALQGEKAGSPSLC